MHAARHPGHVSNSSSSGSGTRASKSLLTRQCNEYLKFSGGVRESKSLKK